VGMGKYGVKKPGKYLVSQVTSSTGCAIHGNPLQLSCSSKTVLKGLFLKGIMQNKTKY